MISKVAGRRQSRAGMTALEFALIAGIVAVSMVAVRGLLLVIGEAV